MQTKDFLDLYTGRGKAIHGTIEGWNYLDYMKLAELTQYIKFECNFDDSGVCKNYKGSDNSDIAMCCCSACFHSIGYLNEIPYERFQIDKYARNFKNKVGFWRAKGGCVLPRSMRSRICLRHNCDYNVWRPDSVKWLLRCLDGKEGSMKIPKHRAFHYPDQLIKYLTDWLQEEVK